MKDDISWIVDGTSLKVFKDTNLIYENSMDKIVEKLVEEIRKENV